jgi:hypothetical protein
MYLFDGYSLNFVELSFPQTEVNMKSAWKRVSISLERFRQKVFQ